MEIKCMSFNILGIDGYDGYLPVGDRAQHPPEIQSGFAELEEFLKTLPLDDNNAVFNLTCWLCTAYEHKAFLDGLQFGAELMLKLQEDSHAVV